MWSCTNSMLRPLLIGLALAALAYFTACPAAHSQMPSTLNLNSTTPAAPAGQQNHTYQTNTIGSTANVSSYTPACVGDSGTGGLAGSVPAPPAGSYADGYILAANCQWIAAPFDAAGDAATAQSNAEAYAQDADHLSSGTVASARLYSATTAAQGAVVLPAGAVSNTLGTAAMTSSSAYDAAGSAATAQSNAETYALAADYPYWNSQGIAIYGQTATNTLNGVGDSLTACASSASSLTPASSGAPGVIMNASAASSGDCAGWKGWGYYWPGRYPLLKWGVIYNAAGDYGATYARIKMGLITYSGVQSTFDATALPAYNYAVIRFDTSIPDTYYMCVTSNGSNTTATAIGTTKPSLAYTVMSISWSAAGVTCTVGSTSVINTSAGYLPSSSGPYSAIWDNATLQNSATHLGLNGGYGCEQTGPSCH